MNVQNDDVLLLARGRIRCRRCSARSKRTKLRCGAPAMKGKSIIIMVNFTKPSDQSKCLQKIFGSKLGNTFSMVCQVAPMF